jgi:hypothetical protein
MVRESLMGVFNIDSAAIKKQIEIIDKTMEDD